MKYFDDERDRQLTLLCEFAQLDPDILAVSLVPSQPWAYVVMADLAGLPYAEVMRRQDVLCGDFHPLNCTVTCSDFFQCPGAHTHLYPFRRRPGAGLGGLT